MSNGYFVNRGAQNVATCPSTLVANINVPFDSGPPGLDLVANSLTEPCTWALGSGTLPPGLTVDLTTGAITGTVTDVNAIGISAIWDPVLSFVCSGGTSVRERGTDFFLLAF